MRKSILLIFVTLLAAAGSARSIDIIPRPAEITEARGEFRITAQTAIAAVETKLHDTIAAALV